MRKLILSLIISSTLPTCALNAQDNENIPGNKVDLDKNKPKNSSTLIREPVTELKEPIAEHNNYSNKKVIWEKVNYEDIFDLKRINSDTSIVSDVPSLASPLKPDGITTSLSEKGLNFGVFKNLSNKNQLNIGIIYFNSKFLPFDIKYNDDRIKYTDKSRKIQYENIGLNLGFKRFLTGDLLTSGIYMGLNGEVISPSLKSRINMANESYKSGNLTITCTTCGDLLIETDPDKLVFIPSLTLGYETKIRQNLKADLSLGVQYVNFPEIVWSYEEDYELPSQLSSRVDEGVADFNDDIDSIPNVIPTLKVGLTYMF